MLRGQARLGQQSSSHLVHLRRYNLPTTRPRTPRSAVVAASRPSQALQLTRYAATHASVSSRRISSISGAITYLLRGQARLGQQSSHLVHLRRYNLRPARPGTPRSAVVASRPSQALQLTHYAARHASVSSRRRISSISGATTYLLRGHARFGQQSSHLVHLRRYNLLSTRPGTRRISSISVSSRRISSISGAITYYLRGQARLGQQSSSHLVHLRRYNLRPARPGTPRSAVVASRPSQALQLTHYAARHASVSSRRRISSILGANLQLTRYARRYNLPATRPRTLRSAVVASRPSQAL